MIGIRERLRLLYWFIFQDGLNTIKNRLNKLENKNYDFVYRITSLEIEHEIIKEKLEKLISLVGQIPKPEEFL